MKSRAGLAMVTMGLILLTYFSVMAAEGPDTPGTDVNDVTLDALRASAEQGDAEARYRLGAIYRDGKGVPRDLDIAVGFFAAAAEQDHTEAIYELAKLMEYDSLPTILRKAEEQGKSLSEEQKRQMETQAFVLAMSFYKKAADLNHARAQFRIGEVLQWGENNVDMNSELALDWYKRAAENGHPPAEYLLGVACETGTFEELEFPKQPEAALVWFQRAATDGHAAAQVRVGRLYQFGEGVAKDPNKAFEYYAKAAAQGDLDGKVGMADMYAQGLAVRKDPAKAETLLKEAVEQGSIEAAAALGALHETRLGDRQQAYVWYTLAAGRQHPASQARIEEVKRKLTEQELAVADQEVEAFRHRHPAWSPAIHDPFGGI